MIKRILSGEILDKIGTGKAIMLMGARQVGKTTLLRELLGETGDCLWLNGDELDVQALLAQSSATRWKSLVGANRVLVIDEAQRIQDIGIRIKLLVDELPQVQVIATGSSSLMLADMLNEPLTGRKWEYSLYPISFQEMVNHHGLLMEKRQLAQRLVFGYYPDVLNSPAQEREILRLLSDSYLYRDILQWGEIHKPERLVKLLQALAFQVGNQVSYSELGTLCQLDAKTVEKYIQVLERAFVIFRLGSFSRNLRNELKFSRKIYFYDNGIRNAVLANFAPIESRADAGVLWENWVIAERLKFNTYAKRGNNSYFWRTTAQQEIDYIEEVDGQIFAYEMKWGVNAKFKRNARFIEQYNPAEYAVITPENVDAFLTLA